MSWDPTTYEQFADERSRPFTDLVARVGAADPHVVVDLGCGTGRLTLRLAQRWPGARVVGVDSSAEMLAAARAQDGAERVEWVEHDVATWAPDVPVDVYVTNAVLQWVPGHLRMLPRWVDQLAPGGWFAMQVPGNFGAPSHALLREVAARSPWSAQLSPRLRDESAVGGPATYASLLTDAGCAVDVWETTYLHVLDPTGEQDTPVLEWVRGTALRPLLGVLDPEDEAAFLRAYAEELRAAYPRRPMGTPFPFRRVFAVGHTRAP